MNLPSRSEIEAELKYRREHKFESFFPATGPLRRELYPRHVEFLNAGATKNERLFMAANRVGKSLLGAYEVTCHSTGIYPTFWEGRRFTRPVEVWVCGQSAKTAKEILQRALLSDPPRHRNAPSP
jgi:hypothetical protein